MTRRAKEVKREREELINTRLRTLSLKTLQSLKITKSFRMASMKKLLSAAVSENLENDENHKTV